MRIQVLLFAHAAERVGASAVALELPDPATVRDALDALEAAHPAIGPMRPVLAVAVNHVYSDVTTPVSDGDELALIPPVSGG